MLKNLKSYITENDFRITYIKNKLNIVNYEYIDHFSDEKVLIRSKEGNIIVKGENLIISKMLNDEILIIGTIKTIEIK